MGGAREGGSDSRATNSRYSGYNVATRPATVGNIATALAGALPGGGLVQRGVSMARGNGVFGDPYEGPVGHTTGYSYDGRDRFSTALGGSGSRRPSRFAATALQPPDALRANIGFTIPTPREPVRRSGHFTGKTVLGG